jgi:ADP-ribosyl-[dinitrogen reductase] hydrolase
MGAPTTANPTPLRNCYWVLPGKVLAGEHPLGSNPQATRERLQRLMDAGVECFIDLTEPGELKRYDPELPFSIEYLRKPIKDHGIPAQHAHMAEILDCLHDALSSGRCVYVHCRAGIGRTGTVIGCLLVERGLAGDAALEELNRLWQHCERSQSWPSIPETDDQMKFVRAWKARGLFNDTDQFVAPAAQTSKADEPTALGADAPPWAHLLVDSPSQASAFVAAPNEAKTSADTGTRVKLSVTNTDTRKPSAGEPPSTPWLGEALQDSDPLMDPGTLSAASNLRGRFLGALVGLAVGDAVAAATQYRRPGTFTSVGDMLGGGPFDLPRGAWSDDTAMALCLADSLLDRDGFDARDQVERYRRWQQDGYLSATGQCVGITASVSRAIAMAQWRRQAFSGSHDPSQVDPETLSRVASAVLFFFADGSQAIEQAAEAARTTCQVPAVLDACRSLARALHAALSGQPKAVVLEQAVLAGSARTAAGAGSPASTAGGAAGVAAHRADIRADIRVGTSAPAALAAAVAALGATDNFRDAILYAVNLGGDSDVVAAVAGQLAGAYYGVKAIPTSWHNSLIHKELIAGYADRLLTRALVGLAG